MPSSISSSETRHLAVFVLLLILAAILFNAELSARFVVDRHSKVQVMVNREHAEALSLRPGRSQQPKQLLIVGSSFVGMDLDFPLLQSSLEPAWKVHRYWLYNTYYNDWYYGIKRLLENGSRPDALAIAFSTTSFHIDGIRGDYSSYYLYQPRDLLSLQADANLDNTDTANLLFARYSRFYGLRSEIRKVLLQRILPDLPRMYELFHPTAGKPLTSPEITESITPRIARLQTLASHYGVRLLLIVPPLPRPGQEFQHELREAAARVRVPVVMPYAYADVPSHLFLDDVHLTPEGATRFTDAAAPLLARALGVVSGNSAPTALNLEKHRTQSRVMSPPPALAVQHLP